MISAQDTNVSSWLCRFFSFPLTEQYMLSIHSHKLHTILWIKRLLLQKILCVCVYADCVLFAPFSISMGMKFTWKWTHSFDDPQWMKPINRPVCAKCTVWFIKEEKKWKIVFFSLLSLLSRQRTKFPNWTYFKCRKIWISNEVNEKVGGK